MDRGGAAPEAVKEVHSNERCCIFLAALQGRNPNTTVLPLTFSGRIVVVVVVVIVVVLVAVVVVVVLILVVVSSFTTIIVLSLY